MASIQNDTPVALTRIQTNSLAAHERRLLNWICARLPDWTTPDMLTATALFGALLIFTGNIAAWLSPAWLLIAVIGYFIHWFGDSLDGSLARFRKIERPSYGYFIDHSCDAIAVTMIITSMGLGPYMRMDVALIALAGYLLLMAHTFLCARVLSELNLTHIGAGPTEMRLLLISMAVTMMAVGTPSLVLGNFSGFDLFTMAAAAIMITLFVVQTARIARRLALADPSAAKRRANAGAA